MPVFALSTLRSKVLARLDDNADLYTLAEIDAIINECVRTVNLFTGFCRSREVVPGGSVANQLTYSTPAGLIAPIMVHFAGRQIQKISLKKLARTHRTWATDTTASRGAVEFWAPVGAGKFVLTPKPSTAGREILVTGMAEPPLLVNAADVLSLENEYVELITEYCAHRLPLKEGGKIFADGSLQLNDFYSKLKERKRLESYKQPKYWLLESKRERIEP